MGGGLIIYVYVDRRPRYWVAMNNGRPIVGEKRRAATFSSDVAPLAVRQVAALFPPPAHVVGALPEGVRFSKKVLADAQ